VPPRCGRVCKRAVGGARGGGAAGARRQGRPQGVGKKRRGFFRLVLTRPRAATGGRRRLRRGRRRGSVAPARAAATVPPRGRAGRGARSSVAVDVAAGPPTLPDPARAPALAFAVPPLGSLAGFRGLPHSPRICVVCRIPDADPLWPCGTVHARGGRATDCARRPPDRGAAQWVQTRLPSGTKRTGQTGWSRPAQPHLWCTKPSLMFIWWSS